MDHYRKNYDTLNGMFLEKIIHGGSIKDDIENLRRKSKEYWKRTTLGMRAHEALELCNAVVLMDDKFGENSKLKDVLYNLWRDTYDVEHDDLFMIAAFENYAKASLLSKGYVVHQIKSPNKLCRKQHTTPIHIRTIRSKNNLKELYLKHNTISMTQILEPNYIKALGLSEKETISIKKCKSIRNSIHFGGPKIYGLGSELYDGLIELKKRILS